MAKKLRETITSEVQTEWNQNHQGKSAVSTFIDQLPEKLKRSFELKFVEEAMFVDFYSGTFYSLISKFKRKHNILLEDQTEYYFEALFLLFVQATFCVCIIMVIDWDLVFAYEKKVGVNLVLFFTTLILHFASVCPIRNGFQMCRYTVFHHDQLTHPTAAFMLGLLVILVNGLCEITNTLYLLTQDTVAEVISKFVAFRVLIQVNVFYNNQRINFPIKKEVAASPLVIVEDKSKVFGKKLNKEAADDDKEQELLSPAPADGPLTPKDSPAGTCSMITLYYIYRFIRAYYTTFYFYYFPLTIIIIPFARLL